MESARSRGAGASGVPALAAAVSLTGEGGSIAEARHFAADFLTRARTDHSVSVSARAMDLTQLVASELVTNAHKYAPGPVLMELRIAGALVSVTVRDGVRARPAARAVDPLRVGQHGLEIVMAVAHAFRVDLEPDGKRVTASIALTDEPA
ncbi:MULTISPECIES: ATP-binding protein [Streptomyces]|uniref:ATP-binding protein n=1 Tax=Streptomyces apricus TaxID=1828112 RepID=A0A5B0BL20_9ACTN|nr:ATP-binding protein [Streptomyces apricus]KAA0941425.1 ATP-binding protein [Streptomyces apricus]